jgi:hypothetical protein
MTEKKGARNGENKVANPVTGFWRVGKMGWEAVSYRIENILGRG